MSTLALLAVIFFAALAGTSTGFGTSMILVPILALFFPFPETLVFVGIIHWFGDIWKMGLFWKGRQWRLVLLFGVPGIIASAFGAGVAVVIPEQIALRILGMVLIGYAFFAYLHPRWQVKPTRRNAVFGGAASGFLAGAFGLGGAVRGAFLSAFTRKSAVYLFTSGAIGLVVDSSRLVTYWLSGVQLEFLAPRLLLLAVPVSLLAALLAKRLVEPLSGEAFRKMVAVGLFLIGLLAVWRAV